jgi:hypothetical protein
VYPGPEFTVNIAFCPWQIIPEAELLDMLKLSRSTISTREVAILLLQSPTFTTNEYIPDSSAVTSGMVGSSRDEVKLLGPSHVYVAPATVPVPRFSVEPAHKGAFEVMTGSDGTDPTPAVTVNSGDEATLQAAPSPVAVTL